MDGRAKDAAIYPDKLCRAIVVGLIKQLQVEAMQIKHLMTVTAVDTIQEELDDRRARGVGAHEEDDEAWDDVTGEILDAKEVVNARLKEISYIDDKKVWIKITRAEAKRRGIKIVGTRWLDINKGDAERPNHRSRLVAKEFNRGKDESLFAATPPLEALRILVSFAATVEGKKVGEKVIMVNDIARAFFEADATRELCVELPDEVKDQDDMKNDHVALLKKSLYGTRDASANFQKEIRRFMANIGFDVGKYNVSTFHHKQRGIRTLVHGDDFVSTCERKEAKWLKEQLENRFEIKTTVIGHGPEEAREGKVLNRVIRAVSDGFEYGADQRHGEILVRTLKLEESKAVNTPGEAGKPWLEGEEKEALDMAKAAEYRALAARANYLAADRPDIQYATKEVCTGMATPTVGDRRKLKRMGRFLAANPRVVARFPFQAQPEELTGYSDSDWAGCRRTARSTRGGVVMVGQHFLKSWSSTQKSVTLSSGEAELVAAVKMATELIGMTQLYADWGIATVGRLWVDSSAALGVVQRRGNGKLRHVRVGTLWIQEVVEEGDLKVQKVDGEENPGDLCTKNVPGAKMTKFMEAMNFSYEEGRAEVSLRV